VPSFPPLFLFSYFIASHDFLMNGKPGFCLARFDNFIDLFFYYPLNLTKRFFEARIQRMQIMVRFLFFMLFF
ncbi:MAG: hypothetical protein ABIG40_03075, partial [Parcubacteria group bacterium]